MLKVLSDDYDDGNDNNNNDDNDYIREDGVKYYDNGNCDVDYDCKMFILIKMNLFFSYVFH